MFPANDFLLQHHFTCSKLKKKNSIYNSLQISEMIRTPHESLLDAVAHEVVANQ